MIEKELIEKIRHIEVRSARLVNTLFSGEYHSVFKGQGMEFAEVREYAPGDDVRGIDWNVTARTGTPYIKRFMEERELTLILMVDCSGSGEFGTGERSKRESGVEASAMLAFSALKNKDRVGLLLFTDRVELYIPPKKGRTHALRIIRELLYFKPRGKGTSIATALQYLMRVEKRRGILFLVSDFQDRGFRKELIMAKSRHDLIAVELADGRERELPPLGLMEFEDSETGEWITVDTSHRETMKAIREKVGSWEKEKERLFHSLAIDRILIETEKSVVDPLVRFFKMRMRKQAVHGGGR